MTAIITIAIVYESGLPIPMPGAKARAIAEMLDIVAMETDKEVGQSMRITETIIQE